MNFKKGNKLIHDSNNNNNYRPFELCMRAPIHICCSTGFGDKSLWTDFVTQRQRTGRTMEIAGKSEEPKYSYGGHAGFLNLVGERNLYS